MSLGRRDFMIQTVSTAAAATLLPGCSDDDNPGSGPSDAPIATLPVDKAAFAHGVASGDPLTESVILWTRVSGQSATATSLEVRCVVATDPALTQVVKDIPASALAAQDWTVKLDVTGLSPGTTYYYAFGLANGRSVTGRTRTLARTLDRARIAFTSCANYQNGYFNAYRAIAARADLDIWIHLGDYIYEYAAGTYADPALGSARAHQPANEATTLADYRTRYGQYRTDPDLQEIHRQHPLIVVWDDHEFANNANVDGAENHMSNEGDWTARKRAGSQAFLEWLPIRVPDQAPVAKIFRTFAFGELFDLIMLDTRMIGRAAQSGDISTSLEPMSVGVGEPSVWNDPTRQLLGTEQESWFLQELTKSRMRGARWRLIGNQVIFAQARDPLMPTKILNADFWDGYQVARQRVVDHLLTEGINNVVFLTGDIHTSWAFEISKNPFDPAVYAPDEGRPGFAIELVGPSVTSLGFEDKAEAPFLVPFLQQVNPHNRYGEITRKGYVLVDVDSQRLQAEWWYVRDVKQPNAPAEDLAKVFTCQQSAARLIDATATGASAPRPAAPSLAPA